MPFDPGKFAAGAVAQVQSQVGSGKVIIGASGGVDSTVAAAIGAKALGRRMTAVFVDTGLLRKDEPAQAVHTLKGLGLKLVHVDASKACFNALRGVKNPENKRKVIGEKFVRVF